MVLWHVVFIRTQPKNLYSVVNNSYYEPLATLLDLVY